MEKNTELRHKIAEYETKKTGTPMYVLDSDKQLYNRLKTRQAVVDEEMLREELLALRQARYKTRDG